MLADQTTNQGMTPEEAVDIVVDAACSGTYLVPTKPSYAGQLRERYDALVARRLPPVPTID